jgi:hypothetical protein
MIIKVYSYKNTLREQIWQGRSEDRVFFIRHRHKTLGIGYGRTLEEAVVKHFKLKIPLMEANDMTLKDLGIILSKLFDENVFLVMERR